MPRVRHDPRLYRAFLRGVAFDEAEEVFVVRLGHFRGQIEVEDTAWWVVSYDAPSGSVTLTDGSAEPLSIGSLTIDPDDALRCTVKRCFPARFTRAGQAHLLDCLDEQRGALVLRVGDTWQPLPPLGAETG